MADPPHFVAVRLTEGGSRPDGPGVLPGGMHRWTAALFGMNMPDTVTVTLRVAK